MCKCAFACMHTPACGVFLCICEAQLNHLCIHCIVCTCIYMCCMCVYCVHNYARVVCLMTVHHVRASVHMCMLCEFFCCYR